MAMLSKGIYPWLIHLADPENDQLTSPGDPVDISGLKKLLSLGSEHTVLPAVVQNLRKLAGQLGAASVVRDGSGGKSPADVLDATLETVSNELLKRTGLCLALRRQAAELKAALAEIQVPTIELKGGEFADRLYPDPSLRGFTDVDMLIAEESRESAFEVMADLGYRMRDIRMKYDTGYGEVSFTRDGQVGGNVEIHWNLVNSPTLRRGISVKLEDLQFKEAHGESALQLSAGSLLLIAGVHGAASHSFDRLSLLCDVCQAARGAAGQIDTDWLAAAARRTGSCLAMTVALELAGNIFDEPRCTELLEQLELPPTGRIWKLLLSPGVVLRAHAAIDSPRRSIFRQLLKRSR